MDETEVLVVGGGAAGSMLSLELARHGVAARTVDRLRGPTTTSRAIALHARTAEMLERIDGRLIAPFLDRAIENAGYVLHFVDGEGRRSEVRPGIDFTVLDSRYACILVHGQSDTERYIRDYLREQFGREVEWGRECTGIEADAGGVTATIVDRASGREERIRCRYLVACDGINSRVRRELRLEQDESDYAGTVLQNMDVFLENFPDVDDYIHYCAGTDHFVMVVKLPGGFFRLLLSDRGESAGQDVTPEQAFLRILDRHFDGVTLGKLVWHSKWESWVRLAHSYRAGNVFLAGDSAHVHSTTGGQGMNCCMQDALNLGWKLGLVLRGLAGDGLLESYETERKPIAGQVIWAASSLHEIFMGHGKPIAERAEKIRDAEFLSKVVGYCSGIDYSYREMTTVPPGLTPVPGPAAGDRAPDVDFGGGESLFALTRHPYFTLCLLPGTAGEARAAGAARAKPATGAKATDGDASAGDILERTGGRYGAAIRRASLPAAPALERHYGRCDGDRLLLIRPDGYVGFHCRADEAPLLEACLDGYFRS